MLFIFFVALGILEIAIVAISPAPPAFKAIVAVVILAGIVSWYRSEHKTPGPSTS